MQLGNQYFGLVGSGDVHPIVIATEDHDQTPTPCSLRCVLFSSNSSFLSLSPTQIRMTDISSDPVLDSRVNEPLLGRVEVTQRSDEGIYRNIFTGEKSLCKSKILHFRTNYLLKQAQPVLHRRAFG